LSFDLVHSCIYIFFFTISINNDSVVFVNVYLFSGTKIFKSSIFKFESSFFRNHCTTGKNGDVLKHSFSSITKTRCFYRSNFK